MSKSVYKKTKNSLVYVGACCALALGRSVPRKLGLIVFGALGKIAFLFGGREKKRTIEHLRFIYGNSWSEKKIKTTASNVFQNLGKNLFDSIRFSALSGSELERFVEHDSFAEVDEAYKQGKGIITITAHTGCFEMLLHYFAGRGFQCFAIGRKMYDKRLEKLIRKGRSGENIEYMNRSDGTRRIVRKLCEGKVFGVLIDQDTKVEGVFADFLGHKAFTPSGPVKMAMKFGIPVFVVTTVRKKDNTHRVFISKKLDFRDTGKFDEDLVANVEMVNGLICDTIRKYPEQWVWMHRRWKHKAPQSIERS